MPAAKPKNWTERLFEKRDGAVMLNCRTCGIEIYIPPSQVGQRACCSIECKTAAPKKEKVGHWGKRLWEKRQGTIEKACEGCCKTMHLPPSKCKVRFCSLSCRKDYARHRRTKNCGTCGVEFYSRKLRSRYCSQACNPATKAVSSPENLAKAQEGKRAAIAEGRLRFPSGPENKLWKGGPKGLRDRQIASGKAAAWTRRYRAENPDKVKEFAIRRHNRKGEKLPYGTIPKIRTMQKDRCAICKVKLNGRGHADHIMPLARGGSHAPANIQLLCAPCNLTKSAKDPIAFMQSLGRLL